VPHGLQVLCAARNPKEDEMAKAYTGIVGAVLLLVGIVGFLMPSLMGMEFFLVHNIIHVVSGLVLLAGTFIGGGENAKTYALIFGVVYTLVAVLGFVGIHDLGSIKLGLNMQYNIVHIAVGLLGILAGFMGGK
jgi:preprotein translocase subunit Sss1